MKSDNKIEQKGLNPSNQSQKLESKRIPKGVDKQGSSQGPK